MFKKVTSLFKSYIKNQKGQTTLEYILIIAVLVIIAIIAMYAIGQKIKAKGQKIEQTIDSGNPNQ